MSQELTKYLEAADVRFVRILWCDNANIIRGKAVHLGMLSHYLEHGVGISTGQQGIPVTSLLQCSTCLAARFLPLHAGG